MNRRSLLLGSVIASVAGILGVKAKASVLSAGGWHEIQTPWFDGRDTAVKVVDRSWLLNKLEQDPAIQSRLVERIKENLVSSDAFVPSLWADEVMSTFNKPSLFRSVTRTDSTYRHSINPDLSDLAVDDAEDTDDYDFWDS